MNNLREAAYRIDPALWVRDVLGVTPTAWQETFLRSPRGSSILALTARQVGKTTTAVWAIAHSMVFMPGSLSVIACPAQRQSAEAVRRVCESLLKVGAELESDNVYALELKNGSRVLALPGSDDSTRGLTVDAWIVADEAARLNSNLIAALRPMRARRPQARFVMLSTAWSRSDPFWTAWASDDQTWIRLKATADTDPALFAADFLEQERRALGEDGSSANTSVSRSAQGLVRSAGTCTSAPRKSTCLWCHPARHFAHLLASGRYRLPILSTASSQSERCHDIQSGRSQYLALFQAAHHCA
jgi:hypothetical protein